MVPFLKENSIDKHVLYMDNLKAHRTEELETLIKENGGVPWFLLSGFTGK